MFRSTRPRRARRRPWVRKPSAEAFRSTRPRRARRAARITNRIDTEFRSTRPRRARPWTGVCWLKTASFRSTRPRRARRQSDPRQQRRLAGFDPRAREGRDLYGRKLIDPRVGFDPRAREGRDLLRFLGGLRINVSIHAPAKGATLSHLWQRRIELVSIHAPAKGATRSWRCDARHLTGFDPRAREGRDMGQFKIIATTGCFDPRAREGRDDETVDQPYVSQTFRSTRPRRARRFYDFLDGFAKAFRSTRPRRARPHAITCTSRRLSCFDPRAREGRDCNTGAALDLK